MKYFKNIKLYSLLSGILFLLCPHTFAQVSIGSDAVASRAAILDIKTQEGDANNITSTSGGLLLPRVQLQDRASLQPFIADSDADISSQKKIHTGLMVYNIAPVAAQGIVAGAYVWDGDYWVFATEVPTAGNGLTKTGNSIALGGTLTKPTTITSSQSAPLIIDGGFKYLDGNQGEGKVLTSDTSGGALWKNAALTTSSGTFDLVDIPLTSSYSSYIRMYVTVPTGYSTVYVGGLARGANAMGYVTLRLSGSDTSIYDTSGFTNVPSAAGFTFNTVASVGQVAFYVNNTSGAPKTLYVWAGAGGGASTVTWVQLYVAEPFIFVAY